MVVDFDGTICFGRKQLKILKHEHEVKIHVAIDSHHRHYERKQPKLKNEVTP
ncbi:hypothetical protein D3C81_2204980 [compost metagenome]